jgi:hypothetical protein
MDDVKKLVKAIDSSLPRCPEVKPRTYTKKLGRAKGFTPNANQLRALRANAVPEGKCLNPYGKLVNTWRGKYRATFFKLKFKPAWREKAMERKRLKLKAKQAIALEAHELQQLARENATAAMRTLIEITRNKRAPEATRIAASQVILDRGYGKASQTSITANVTNGKTAEIDSRELDKRIGQALKRVEDLTNRTPKAGISKKRPSDLRKYN